MENVKSFKRKNRRFVSVKQLGTEAIYPRNPVFKNPADPRFKRQ